MAQDERRSGGASAPPESAALRKLPRTTHPRLRDFDYSGRHAYHITVVTANRGPLLVNETAVRVAATLRDAAHKTSFELHAFTIMPDHLHALVLGLSNEANLVRFVQLFKQLTAFVYKKATGARLWQPSFHDHAIRQAEDLVSVARYILENPVRAGLAASRESWPYSGGLLVHAAFGGAEAPPLRRGLQGS